MSETGTKPVDAPTSSGARKGKPKKNRIQANANASAPGVVVSVSITVEGNGSSASANASVSGNGTSPSACASATGSTAPTAKKKKKAKAPKPQSSGVLLGDGEERLSDITAPKTSPLPKKSIPLRCLSPLSRAKVIGTLTGKRPMSGNSIGRALNWNNSMKEPQSRFKKSKMVDDGIGTRGSPSASAEAIKGENLYDVDVQYC